jgi:hypothetical protein
MIEFSSEARQTLLDQAAIGRSRDAIALANKVAGQQPMKFAAWAKALFPIPSST